MWSVESQPIFRSNMAPLSKPLLPTCLLLLSCLTSSLTLKIEQYSPPKRRLTGNGLRGVISQKIEFVITTAVRTYVGPLSPLHGASSGFGWRRLPPGLEGSCDYIA
jgi:hypothetical protein